MKRNPGQASRHDPGFRFAQSGLLPRSDDQLISLDPELRAGAVEVAFGEEVRRMGRALAKPINRPTRGMMGFASLYPSYALRAWLGL